MKTEEVTGPSGPRSRRFISIQALARKWGVSDSTVRRLIEEGRLRGIKVRRSCKIFIESVEEYEKTSEF